MASYQEQTEVSLPGKRPLAQPARPDQYCDDAATPQHRRAEEPAQPNRYLQIAARMARKHRLLSVHWELTYRCNEKCTHCYLDVFAPNASVPGELTTGQCRQVLDQLAELNALNITFSGGEILVRKDFFEVAEYARELRFSLRLMTNAIGVTPGVADRIASLYTTGVEVSLYSSKPDTHDSITLIPGSHAATIRGIKELRACNVNVVVKMPLMRETVRDLPEVRALAENLGVQLYYDPTITPKNSGDTRNLKHRLKYEDLIWLFEEEITPENWIKPAIVPDNYRSCSIGMHSIDLDPYGDVYPCVQARMSAGNVLEAPLKQIWEESPVFRSLMGFTYAELPVCSACELNNICSRCHGMALTEHGDFTAPAAVNCREALARRDVLIKKGLLPEDYPIPGHLADEALMRDEFPERAPVDMIGYTIPDLTSINELV